MASQTIEDRARICYVDGSGLYTTPFFKDAAELDLEKGRIIILGERAVRNSTLRAGLYQCDSIVSGEEGDTFIFRRAGI